MAARNASNELAGSSKLKLIPVSKTARPYTRKVSRYLSMATATVSVEAVRPPA